MSKVIELSHALKVELLKAIQYGKLDLELFDREIKLFYKIVNDDWTIVEINSEMERLLKFDKDFETCRILQKIGLCHKNLNGKNQQPQTK